MAGRERWLVALLLLASIPLASPALSQEHSVARQWNEVLLEAIRNDFARPTIHARNLFHVSMAMYDAWAAYDEVARPYLLGQRVRGYPCLFHGVPDPSDVRAAREEAMSYAAYRVLRHRFQNAPEEERENTLQRFDDLLSSLGYDPGVTRTDYASGSPAALGNYVAEQVIEYGRQDGSNETGMYANRYYEPVNPELDPTLDGNPDIVDPNRWQPLRLSEFIGQGGFAGTPSFLSPEWGEVAPFALTDEELSLHARDGYEYWVYHDPGTPPQLDVEEGGGMSEEYKWGFALVAVWSGHLSPDDDVLWDISPGSIGNIFELPESVEDYPEFYGLLEGGDIGEGHEVNPHTGQPYEPQMVPRGDYARVLAEFWADGPDSETPPGHWFTILNYVHDHPDFERRYRGEGPPVDPLEWDVKAYFTLGGAMHDAAVTSWGIKGWYDYVRPVSAIRLMAEYGQSSDPGRPSYHPAGLPLIDGAIELIDEDDPLAGPSGEFVGKIKLRAWRGPFRIFFPETDEAGVDWILAERWWPYQRPTFVTPPFAGYVSGHSTFSRAAAEVLTLLTGDPFFPGGMGEFHAEQNEFLVFEDGPSVDVTLQWATYRDASDQTSLSRIWGGIHPPADDIPGRHIGIDVGTSAFEFADLHFRGGDPRTTVAVRPTRVFPNPVRPGRQLVVELLRSAGPRTTLSLFDLRGRLVRREARPVDEAQRFLSWDLDGQASGVYFLRVTTPSWEGTHKITWIR